MNKKVSLWKKLLIGTGSVAVVLFFALFIWANLEPLSPGQKAAPVRFAQFDISSISDSTQVVSLKNSILQLEGVTAAAFSMESQILSVGYQIDATDCSGIQSQIKSALKIDLNQKNIETDKPQCPMTATRNALSNLKKTLNVRN